MGANVEKVSPIPHWGPRASGKREVKSCGLKDGSPGREQSGRTSAVGDGGVGGVEEKVYEERRQRRRKGSVGRTG